MYSQSTPSKQPVLSHGGITFSNSAKTVFFGGDYYDNILAVAPVRVTFVLSLYLASMPVSLVDIFSKEGGSASTVSFFSRLSTTNFHMTFPLTNTVNLTLLTTSFTPQVGTRYNFIITLDTTQSGGNQGKVYVNGIIQSLITDTDQLNSVSNTPYPISIGGPQLSTTTRHFDGTIFAIHIYNKVFTQQDVTDMNDYLNTTYTYV